MPDHLLQEAPAVRVCDLHKSFGAVEVLKGIDLEAAKGDVISILGSSGSGKSTFLRCINFLETPNTGSVQVADVTVELKGDGVRPDRRLVRALRQRTAMVFQNFNLWTHMTVLENVVAGPRYGQSRPRAECVAEAEALLEKVGIADKRHEYPAYLSGGQQQRAAIARALAMSPQVLLFDEPTSALDPELVGEVLKVIQKLAEEGRTMLIVTHEMAFARNVSDRIMFLHQGLVDTTGTPADLFAGAGSDRFKKFIASDRD